MNNSYLKNQPDYLKDREDREITARARPGSSSCEEPGMITAASRREKDGVDHVDDPVARFDIGLGDLGTVDLDALVGINANIATVDGLGGFEARHVSG
jgi:hypothetical protein